MKDTDARLNEVKLGLANLAAELAELQERLARLEQRQAVRVVEEQVVRTVERPTEPQITQAEGERIAAELRAEKLI